MLKPNMTRRVMREKCYARFTNLPPHQLKDTVRALISPARTTSTKSMLMAAWQIMEYIES